MIKHKVNKGKDVILNGVVYKCDQDGFVLLPKKIQNKDIEPLEKEPDKRKSKEVKEPEKPLKEEVKDGNDDD